MCARVLGFFLSESPLVIVGLGQLSHEMITSTEANTDLVSDLEIGLHASSIFIRDNALTRSLGAVRVFSTKTDLLLSVCLHPHDGTALFIELERLRLSWKDYS